MLTDSSGQTVFSVSPIFLGIMLVGASKNSQRKDLLIVILTSYQQQHDMSVIKNK